MHPAYKNIVSSRPKTGYSLIGTVKALVAKFSVLLFVVAATGLLAGGYWYLGPLVDQYKSGLADGRQKVQQNLFESAGKSFE